MGISMDKVHTKSTLKVKTSTQSSVTMSSPTRGLRKEEGKERASVEKAKTSPRTSPRASSNKENNTNTKKPNQEFKLHSEERAMRRAMFNYYVATKIYVIEHEKRQLERLQKLIDEEEVKSLRKKMVPRAQLMPYFDKPFSPQRSNRPLTTPREPRIKTVNNDKFMSCISENEMYSFQNRASQHQTWNPAH
ncbi:Microtubule-destabilizing protein 60 [Linum grandiflorum]